MGYPLNRAKYKKRFSGKKRKEKALEHALETRKFEIELYWKRAAYFWTFIAAALAAYGLIQASKDIPSPKKEHLSVLVGVLGLVFSFAWQAVNRASKYWQENWENHVALLENEVTGPLFKSVTRGIPQEARTRVDRFGRYLTSPDNYSVSKVNQLVSIFVMLVWLVLICQAAHLIEALEELSFVKSLEEFFSLSGRPLDVFSIIVLLFGAGACWAIRRLGRSGSHDHKVDVCLYETVIKEAPSCGAPPPSTAPGS